MFGAVLWHFFGEFKIHVLPHALSRFFFEPVNRTDNFSLYRASSGECLNNCLGLKPNRRFSQNSRVDPARPIPRLSPLFVLHPQHFQPTDKHLHPIFSTRNVGVHQTHQIISHRTQLAIVH